MVSHIAARGLGIELTIIIIATVIAVGMLVGFAGHAVAFIIAYAKPLVFGFTGVGAAMLVPISIQETTQDQ